MYISSSLLKKALEGLQVVHPFFGISFLAFKKAGLPIGITQRIVFSQIADDVLNRYYRASHSYSGFYNPFQTSDKSNRWVNRRYGSTSLQRITADTFGDCFIHIKKTSDWAWHEDYVQRLRNHLGDLKIPAFYLASWLFRNENWPAGVNAATIVDKFLREFVITSAERDVLFEIFPEDDVYGSNLWMVEAPVGEAELFDLIGTPPGAEPQEGAALHSMETIQVGPSSHLRYDPAERLNIITGDNSLGKTFLLECIWWALTGCYLDQPLLPRLDAPESKPKIKFQLSNHPDRYEAVEANFDWSSQAWSAPKARKTLSGLVLYARHDGSYALWDPARAKLSQEQPHLIKQEHVFFTRHQVWNGISVQSSTQMQQWVSNGLVRDWVSWQTGGARYQHYYNSFLSCLRALSPSASEPLEPGEPVRMPPDAREMPTLKMPYGDVPVLQASAGVQRILALSYLMVWAWHEHLALSNTIRKKPQRRLVVIIDEVEAHLHPRWQRVIVPALMNVISELASGVSPQIHLATHSPMVLASAETIFDERTDQLHHLRLVDRDVRLEELPFRKRGRADLWLISDVFGLGQARSVPAERAIEEAKAVQLSDPQDPAKIAAIHQQLVRHLAPDDEFWPRWTFFAKQHGVSI